MNRDDLKGIATWDDHRQCYVPENGQRDAVASKLGAGWTFDEYYCAFFASEAEEPKQYDQCATLEPKDACVCLYDGDRALIADFGVPPSLQGRVEAEGVEWAFYQRVATELSRCYKRHAIAFPSKEGWHASIMRACRTAGKWEDWHVPSLPAAPAEHPGSTYLGTVIRVDECMGSVVMRHQWLGPAVATSFAPANAEVSHESAPSVPGGGECSPSSERGVSCLSMKVLLVHLCQRCNMVRKAARDQERTIGTSGLRRAIGQLRECLDEVERRLG